MNKASLEKTENIRLHSKTYWIKQRRQVRFDKRTLNITCSLLYFHEHEAFEQVHREWTRQRMSRSGSCDKNKRIRCFTEVSKGLKRWEMITNGSQITYVDYSTRYTYMIFVAQFREVFCYVTIRNILHYICYINVNFTLFPLRISFFFFNKSEIAYIGTT